MMMTIKQISFAHLLTVFLALMSGCKSTDNWLEEETKVSQTDHDAIMAVISANKELAGDYTFKNMSHIIGLPGGVQKDLVGVILEKSGHPSPSRGLRIHFKKSNDHWEIEDSQRYYDDVGLSKNVSDQVAEMILHAIRNSEDYGRWHHTILIDAIIDESFTDPSPPKGTEYIVDLLVDSSVVKDHNSRQVFVCISGNEVRFLAKHDRFLIY
jgi:hypothetical protein